MCSAEAFSVLYIRVAVQHGEAFIHLWLFTENLFGASDLDRLCGDNRDQVGWSLTLEGKVDTLV